MKFLKTGLSLAVIGATLSVVPTAPSVAVGVVRTDNTSVTAKMRGAADGTVRISTESATGKVGFISARGAGADLLPSVGATSKASAVSKATTYLDQYGLAFGATKGQLKQSGVVADRYGTVVSFDQYYQGVPVFAARLKANVSSAGALTAVSGLAVPDLSLSTTPRLTATDAAQRAVAFVKAEPPTSEGGGTADTTGVKAVTNQLFVYRLGSLRGATGKAVLAYVVEVSNAKNVRDMVFIDANTGKPVNRYSMVADALDRELQEATGTAQAPVLTTVWEEGDPLPGDLNIDQQNLVNSSGESYWMYANAFGRDSYDGMGAKRITVNNDPRINCPNANWNGTTTNYCNGVTSDDVVAHEWGHAYTEYTSGLIYQYQSGALNESYSDVWGETLDIVNGREDEDEVFDAKRVDGACSDYLAPAPTLQVNITAPAAAAGACTAVEGFGGSSYGSTLETAQVVVGLSGAATDGCAALTNAAAVAGNYVYVDRGTCSFQVKADTAVAAGASGIIVGNNVAGPPIAMAGTTTIPGVMITQADGARVKANTPVTMTFQVAPSGGTPGSSRWLIGEKSQAFGGAIRDMWTPTCFGDPGKVTDAEYNCDPDLLDAGGVHSNSGVPNHAYALVVDGGTFNGQTITGLGIDKAANIWWYAQTHYLTEASDFTNAADALEQSCADLVGKRINKIDTTPAAGATAAPSIVAADCASVVDTMKATEMRADPVQCNFQPLLNQGTLSPCGAGTITETTVLDDFEEGLGAWTQEQELAPGANQGVPWEAKNDDVPAGHPGTVAIGPDPDLGSCSAGDDISSRNSLVSPTFTVPTGNQQRVTFDHYVATEGGYDGGNVKMSINDGPFTLVPASAFVLNPYNADMADDTTNTSPLAGQPGYTGTDGGKSVGSWGQSTISLAKLGTVAGDTFKIRFDMGRDGCGGNDGWYIDDLVMSTCKKVATVTAKHVPNPSTYGTASRVDITAAKGATGTVTLKVGGATVGTDTLEDGAASIALPAKLKAGSYAASVAYEGDSQFGPSTSPVAIVVKKAGSTSSVLSASKMVKKGKKATVRIKVGSSAGTPGGRVVLRSGKTIYGAGMLSGGTVKIVTRKLFKVGKLKLVAAYAGSFNFQPSKTRIITITVKKK